jgi:hypothetical protein
VLENAFAPVHKAEADAILRAEQEPHTQVQRQETGEVLEEPRVRQLQELRAHSFCEIICICSFHFVERLENIERTSLTLAHVECIAIGLAHSDVVAVHNVLHGVSSERRVEEAFVIGLEYTRHVGIPHVVRNNSVPHLSLETAEDTRRAYVDVEGDDVGNCSPE